MRTLLWIRESSWVVPTGPEDVRLAEQLTEYVIHILKENDCFTQFQFAFQDALLKRCGIIKVDWNELEDVKTYSYTGLGDEELQVLLMDNNAEDVGVQSYPDPDFTPGPLLLRRSCPMVVLCRWMRLLRPCCITLLSPGER